MKAVVYIRVSTDKEEQQKHWKTSVNFRDVHTS